MNEREDEQKPRSAEPEPVSESADSENITLSLSADDKVLYAQGVACGYRTAVYDICAIAILSMLVYALVRSK